MRCRKVLCEAAVCVLNYLNYKETMLCVDSILLQKQCIYHVIVVDNGSDNDSFQQLRQKYCDEKKVSIIRAHKNYGFAKGHNIGIHYAREHYGARYILLLNSDTLLEDRHYIRKMMDADRDGVGVLGSRILMRDGREYRFEKQYTSFPATLLRYLQLLFYCNGAYTAADFLGRTAEERYRKEEVLHGCALMLTPEYFRYYHGLFDKTFLYEEETLLYLYCKRCGLQEEKTYSAYIVHSGGQSTKLLNDGRMSKNDRLILKSYKFVLYESIRDAIKRSGRRWHAWKNC